MTGAKVYALYVIDISFPESILMDESFMKDISWRLENTGLEATSRVEIAAKASGLEAESVLLKGKPAKEILNFAEKENIDLIVVGSI